MFKRNYPVNKLILLLLTPAILVAVFYLWFHSNYKAYYMPNTTAMHPNLGEGDLIIVKKTMANLAKYGQIVAFISPQDKSTVLIMRIIAKPGDNIGSQNKSLKLNGNLLSLKELSRGSGIVTFEETIENKTYQIQEQETPSYTHTEVQKNLADHQYFLLGDNRDKANDSRTFGPITGDNIIGVVSMIIKNNGSWLYGDSIQ